jgi:4'-phosphopantetheinyl transferase
MTPEILFDPPPEKVELTNGGIHIFCASLDPPLSHLEQLAETLSKDERQRAARFHFERDKNRFVTGRGILREILGWLLGAEPNGLVFSRGVHGKPRLAKPAAGSFLHFNLAHCDSLAVYAVARANEVGIDLERIRPVCETEEIAAHCFSERERAQWLSLPGESRAEAFFNCWTRKEALLKATGEGIGGKMDQIEAFFAGDLPGETPWLLRSLVPALDYTAAVAAECHKARVNCWKWRE